MIDMNNLCMNCMEEKDEKGICPSCKTGGNVVNPKPYLPTKTLVSNHYLVGRVMDFNGEGVTYLSADTLDGSKLYLREYLPVSICARTAYNVESMPGHEAQYKALMSDFVDLAKVIRRLDHIECLVKVRDIFAQNNTAYVVYQAIDGIRLDRFLKRAGGKLPYDTVLPLVLPMLYGLKEMHNQGFIHRGICPRNIYITKTGEIRLFGYSIAAARTAGSELTPELFAGYTAPEQYTPSSWQGAWTDVYAAAAVLYQMLTGQEPQDIQSRKMQDLISQEVLVGCGVPDYSAKAIVKGLALDQNSRTSSMERFIAELTQPQSAAGSTMMFAGEEYLLDNKATADRNKTMVAPSVKTSTYQSFDSQRPQKSSSGKKNPQKNKRPMSSGKIWLISTFISLVILGSISFMLLTVLVLPGMESNSSQSSSSNSSTPTQTDEVIPVPNLVGQMADSVEADVDYADFVFTRNEVEDATAPEGVIIEQSPVAGSDAHAGDTIVITVSKGAGKVELPPLVGRTLTEASQVLDGLNIYYESMVVYDSGEEPGVVIRMDKEAGTMITPNSTTDKVILFVSADDSSSSNSSRGDSSSSNSGGGGIDWH